MKAYPFSHKHPTLGTTSQSEGMDLRDYFAGLAMQGTMIAFKNTPRESISKSAYEMADLMMKARENKDD